MTRTSGKDFVGLKELFSALRQSGISRDTFFHTAIEVYDERVQTNDLAVAEVYDERVQTNDLAVAEVYDERVQTNDLKTWMTISLGTGLKTADDFRRALKKDGYRIGDCANDVLGKPAFTAASEKTEVELIRMTVAELELGFKNGATRKDIYGRGVELGLALCPAEVGPLLRLQYRDQPMGEWLLIAMEPISDSGGDLRVFGVGRREHGSWLYGCYGKPDNFWRGDDMWVFVRRKSR